MLNQYTSHSAKQVVAYPDLVNSTTFSLFRNSFTTPETVRSLDKGQASLFLVLRISLFGLYS